MELNLLYDTHFHLADTDSPELVISRARANGVGLMNLISCDINDTRRNIGIADEFDIFTTAGVHPLYIEKFGGNYNDFLEFYQHPRVIAVGEIGLDFFYHKEAALQEKQKKIFRKFMELSALTKKPAVVHCRDAFEDCYRIISETLQGKQAFVIHCYTGDQSWAEKFLELGAYISYSGIITFNNAQVLRDSLKVIPEERLLIETDAPYLAPVPHRGKRNEPAYVVHVLDRLCLELRRSQQELASMTLENGCRVFGVSAP